VTVRARRPVPLPVAVVVSAASLISCAETTIDSTATTAAGDGAPPTTTFAPTGTTTELLEQLAAETATLSDRVIENEGQREALARITALWALVRPAIETEREQLLGGFDTVVDLLRRSVERRRPADADKAHKNLLMLIAAYEA
jgi:hypothetical protein